MALSTRSGSGWAVNMSSWPAAISSRTWALTSSPSTTAIRSGRPASSISLASALAQPCGLMPPALLTTLMPASAISRSTGRIATSTKSVA